MILNTTNGKTGIDSNGVLHAIDAVISGSIEANTFYASEHTSMSTSELSKDITKTTTITGSTFNIAANGTITPSGAEGIDINNCIYFTILDEVANTNNDEFQENGSRAEILYGVPTLCMMYKGVEYIINPSIWSKLTSGNEQDVSNMRWIPYYDVSNYEFTKPSSNSNNAYKGSYHSGYVGSGGIGIPNEYYIFKESNSNLYISSGLSDSVYRFYVDNFGSTDSQQKQINWVG